MKQKPMTSSTQQQTFESPHQQAMLTGFRRIADDGYPLYIMPVDDPYSYLVAPNPPTPEAVQRAQFVDKTYRWTGK